MHLITGEYGIIWITTLIHSNTLDYQILTKNNHVFKPIVFTYLLSLPEDKGEHQTAECEDNTSK